MQKVWLRPNRRILLVPIVAGGLLALLGGYLALLLASAPWTGLVRAVGWLMLVAGTVAVAVNLYLLCRPRIGYRNGELLFYLRFGAPVSVPIEVVEAFFLGQGEARLPYGKAHGAESINLVARLAERAVEWHRVEVLPALGQWCDGYVTICGTWCEPLGEEVARRLNHWLAETKRSLRNESE